MNLAQTSCKRKRVHFLISFCFTRPKYTNSSKKQDEISSRNDQSCEGAVIYDFPLSNKLCISIAVMSVLETRHISAFTST